MCSLPRRRTGAFGTGDQGTPRLIARLASCGARWNPAVGARFQVQGFCPGVGFYQPDRRTCRGRGPPPGAVDRVGARYCNLVDSRNWGIAPQRLHHSCALRSNVFVIFCRPSTKIERGISRFTQIFQVFIGENPSDSRNPRPIDLLNQKPKSSDFPTSMN